MNLQQLAAAAHVSVSTVSKALSGRADVNAETRERIIGLARENGCYARYSKNRYERKVVAVIVPEVKSEYYTNIIDFLDAELAAQNMELVLSVSHFRPERENQLFIYHTDFQKADGVLLVGSGQSVRNSDHHPLVCIGAEKGRLDVVRMDLDSVMEQVLHHLKELGHRRICYIGEKLTVSKQHAFFAAAGHCGLVIPDEYMVISDKRFMDAGRTAAERILQLKERPTAIVAAYDYMALGAIKYFSEQGIRVPEDFSVIGMDDIPAAACLSIPLTSVRTDAHLLAKAAVELLVQKMDNAWYSSRRIILVPGELMLRGTTRSLI